MSGELLPETELWAMVDACLLDPDDEGPRLILADWLEEHGQHAKALYGPGHWLLLLHFMDATGVVPARPQALFWRPEEGRDFCLGTVEGPRHCGALVPEEEPDAEPVPCENWPDVRLGGKWLCERCRARLGLLPWNGLRPWKGEGSGPPA